MYLPLISQISQRGGNIVFVYTYIVIYACVVRR